MGGWGRRRRPCEGNGGGNASARGCVCGPHDDRRASSLLERALVHGRAVLGRVVAVRFGAAAAVAACPARGGRHSRAGTNSLGRRARAQSARARRARTRAEQLGVARHVAVGLAILLCTANASARHASRPAHGGQRGAAAPELTTGASRPRTSACEPGASTLLHSTHLRQRACQSLPSDVLRSAAPRPAPSRPPHAACPPPGVSRRARQPRTSPHRPSPPACAAGKDGAGRPTYQSRLPCCSGGTWASWRSPSPASKRTHKNSTRVLGNVWNVLEGSRCAPAAGRLEIIRH